MFLRFLILSNVFLNFLKSAHSSNILFYSALSTYSHRIAYWPLAEALADRGHNVSFLHSYEPKKVNPKIREVFPKSVDNAWVQIDKNGEVVNHMEFIEVRVKYGRSAVDWEQFSLPYSAIDLCERLLSNQEMLEFINSAQIDLVIVDGLFNDCGYGLAYKWGAKTILYFANPPTGSWGVETHGFLGTSEPWISDEGITYEMPMTFLNRAKNMGVLIGFHLFKAWIYYPAITNTFKNWLNVSNLPPITDLLGQTSLVFHNSHWSEEETRSLSAKFIAVPALHAWDETTDPLPNNLATFIEASGENGFVYVSFGGEANFSQTPIEFQNIFLNVFSQMKPTRFVWKRDALTKGQVPSNIFTQSWMPQKSILASPKCRGFITHGGLLGMQEAMLAGVPMIVMPIFAEQDYNANRQVRTGRGLKIEAHGLTQQTLYETIKELLSNNSYKEEVNKVRRHLRDQQNKPLDTAVFWTEYVLTHDMPPLHRAHNLYWFQIYFLDVFAFLIVFSVALVTFLLYTFKLIYTFVKSSSSHQKLKTT